MPGSNDFSMAPDIMESAYDTPSSSTPTLTRRSTSAIPKMTSIVGEATVQKPKGIATRPTNVGNLGDPYTNLPKVYTRGNFEQVALKRKYGEDASWWDKQKFKSYLKSDQGIADRNDYIASENAEELKSYQDYARALSAQSKERMLAAKRKFDVAVAKFDQPVEETQVQAPVPAPTPVKKPTVVPRSDAEWNRIAKDNGFTDMKEVAAWQAANGLEDDGKFGNNSSAYFKQNGMGKYQRNPVQTEPETFVQRTPTSTTPAQKQSTPETPTAKVFNLDTFATNNNLSDFRNFNGKRVVRYDPLGRGDWFVDEQGNSYKADGLLGTLGEQIPADDHRYNTELQRKFNTMHSKIQAAYQKQGGTMNRINYFQQGGAAPQQDIKAQVTALVQAAMQGDQKATQQVNQIMEAAKAGDQQAMQLAQLMEQVVKELQGQATSAKWGAKLGYIKSLKYAKGGKTCPACEAKKVEMKACGGKKAPKKYDGGWMELLPIYGTIQSGKRFFKDPSWRGAGEFALDLVGDAALLTGVGAGAGAALKAAKAAKAAGVVAKTAKTGKAYRAAKAVANSYPGRMVTTGSRTQQAALDAARLSKINPAHREMVNLVEQVGTNVGSGIGTMAPIKMLDSWNGGEFSNK